MRPTPRRRWTRCLTKWPLSRTTVGLNRCCGALVFSLHHVCVIDVPSLDSSRSHQAASPECSQQESAAEQSLRDHCGLHVWGAVWQSRSHIERTSTCATHLVVRGGKNEMVKYFAPFFSPEGASLILLLASSESETHQRVWICNNASDYFLFNCRSVWHIRNGKFSQWKNKLGSGFERSPDLWRPRLSPRYQIHQ